MTVENIDKKFVQKRRIVRYYIDAVKHIIESDGIDKVTLRSVSDIAGYNSATLYNYFENLDHLLLFTCLDYMEDYIDDIPNYINYAKDSGEVYLQVWNCFIDHSFINAEIYYMLFFANLQNDKSTYINDYYKMFPLDIKKYNPKIRQMLLATDFKVRSMHLMEQCVIEGIIPEDRAAQIDDIVICVYQSMLMKVKNKSISSGIAREITQNYIEEIFYRMR